MRKTWICLILAGLILLVSLEPDLFGAQTPFSAWRSTDDGKGVQFRYQVLNSGTKHTSCYLEFRDTDNSVKDHTDIEYRFRNSGSV
jgi:hypothetical protein